MISLTQLMGMKQNPYQTQMFGNLPFSVLPQIGQVGQPQAPMPAPQAPMQPAGQGGGMTADMFRQMGYRPVSNAMAASVGNRPGMMTADGGQRLMSSDDWRTAFRK